MVDLLPFLLTMVPGTMFLGAGDIFMKRLLAVGISERALLSILWLSSGAVFWILVLVFGIPPVSSLFWKAFAITAVLNIFGQFAWYRAFALEEASLIAPFRLLIPILVTGTGFIFLKELPSFSGFIGIVITVAGLWFLVQSKTDSPRVYGLTKGMRFALLGAVFFSFSFPFDKLAVVSSSALFSASMVYSAVGAGSFLIGLSFREPFRKSFSLIFQNKGLAILSLLANIFGSLLSLSALNFALVAYASSVKRLQVIWTILFSGAFLPAKAISAESFSLRFSCFREY